MIARLSSVRALAAAIAAGALLAVAPAARAQDLGLSGSGPIEIDAADGIEWRQAERIVIARGNARATRQNVTVHADRLIARYRERARPDGSAPPATQPGRAAAEGPLAGGGANEIWRLEAEGNVRIVAAADRAEGDRAVYDLDQAVLVLTGRNLRILAGSDEVRARDSLEYWSQRRMAVARGAASVTSGDRRLDAAVLVAYLAAPPPPGAPRPQAPPPTSQGQGGGAPLAGALGGSGRIERVEAFDEVLIRTPTESVRGDRGVYLPETGIAQITGQVRITRGQNQLNGGFAEVNLRTGVARLLGGPPGAGGTAPGTSGGRVSGLVVPNEGQAEGAQPQPQQQQQQQRRPANAAPRRLAP